MSPVPVILGLLAVAGAPPAAPAEVELSWHAPADCPTSADVHRELSRLLSRGDGAGEPLVADAQVEREAEGYALRLALTTRSGSDLRTLRAEHCEPLADAAVLIVATLTDPIAVSRHVEALERAADTAQTSPLPSPPALPLAPSPSPSTSPSSSPSPSPSPVVTAAIEPRETSAESDTPPTDRAPDRTPDRDAGPTKANPRPPLRPALRLDGALGIAALPRLDAALALSAGLVARWLRLEIGASHVIAQPRAHPELSDVGLRIRATTGRLRGCGVPSVERWSFPLCLAADLGVMAARGEGIAVSNATLERSFYAATLAEGHVAWHPIERFGLWLGVQGVLNLTRPTFTVDTLDPFFTAPFGGVRATLGVEVRFFPQRSRNRR